MTRETLSQRLCGYAERRSLDEGQVAMTNDNESKWGVAKIQELHDAQDEIAVLKARLGELEAINADLNELLNYGDSIRAGCAMVLEVANVNSEEEEQ